MTRARRLALARASMALVFVGCVGAQNGSPPPTPTQVATSSPTLPASTRPTPTPTPTPTPASFQTAAFAAVTEEPVGDDVAARLESILKTLARQAGMSATVMSARGMWSGATGTADGTRAVTPDTQFSIASTTKAVTAAQVMQLVEAGELGLDDPVADHLPADIDFDTNGATIRNLLGHRSGIPDYVDVVGPKFDADPLRVWTPAELLAAIPADRKRAGGESEYGNVNYLLLGLVIEEVTGRRVVDVLRDGVLAIDGVERLIYQPDEVPTEPIAINNGESHEWFESMGGFLPSLALTSDRTAAAMASDSVSLARWWRALCGGELISQASLTEMLPTDDWYGLGLAYFPPAGVVGHYGEDSGGVSLAGCVPRYGVVFSILANRNGGVVDSYTPERFIDAMKSP